MLGVGSAILIIVLDTTLFGSVAASIASSGTETPSPLSGFSRHSKVASLRRSCSGCA
jgi:hypothetical protein